MFFFCYYRCPWTPKRSQGCEWNKRFYNTNVDSRIRWRSRPELSNPLQEIWYVYLLLQRGTHQYHILHNHRSGTRCKLWFLHCGVQLHWRKCLHRECVEGVDKTNSCWYDWLCYSRLYPQNVFFDHSIARDQFETLSLAVHLPDVSFLSIKDFK